MFQENPYMFPAKWIKPDSDSSACTLKIWPRYVETLLRGELRTYPAKGRFDAWAKEYWSYSEEWRNHWQSVDPLATIIPALFLQIISINCSETALGRARRKSNNRFGLYSTRGSSLSRTAYLYGMDIMSRSSL